MGYLKWALKRGRIYRQSPWLLTERVACAIAGLCGQCEEWARISLAAASHSCVRATFIHFQPSVDPPGVSGSQVGSGLGITTSTKPSGESDPCSVGSCGTVSQGVARLCKAWGLGLGLPYEVEDG